MGDEKAWSAEELAKLTNLPVEKIRRLMIRLENYGEIKHSKEGRYNWYFTRQGYEMYLIKNLKTWIEMILKDIKH